MMIPRILITPGEPAGIGPDVVLQAALQTWPAELIAITDPEVLSARSKALGLPIKLLECDLNTTNRVPHEAGTLRIHPVKFPAPVVAGELNVNNAAVVVETLRIAAELCQQRHADAVVTGPVHKGIINDAGIPFSGHTEFFAQAAGVTQTVMLFVVDQLKAALLTTHLPLKNVADAVTREKLISVLTILHHDLKKYFRIDAPQLLVAGLNPHAGENGHMGREEIDVIIPALEECRLQGMQIQGPLPADTIFTPGVIGNADAVLGMYHDQILPVIKHIGFDRAVNMTLGLPYLRTSVDHGTALDVAGSGRADAGSMKAALGLAVRVILAKAGIS